MSNGLFSDILELIIAGSLCFWAARFAVRLVTEDMPKAILKNDEDEEAEPWKDH